MSVEREPKNQPGNDSKSRRLRWLSLVYHRTEQKLRKYVRTRCGGNPRDSELGLRLFPDKFVPICYLFLRCSSETERSFAEQTNLAARHTSARESMISVLYCHEAMQIAAVAAQ